MQDNRKFVKFAQPAPICVPTNCWFFFAIYGIQKKKNRYHSICLTNLKFVSRSNVKFYFNLLLIMLKIILFLIIIYIVMFDKIHVYLMIRNITFNFLEDFSYVNYTRLILKFFQIETALLQFLGFIFLLFCLILISFSPLFFS